MPETAPQADPDSASPAGAHDDGTTIAPAPAPATGGTGTDSPGPGSAGAGGATRATGT